MYFEEKWIGSTLYWRNKPDGEWTPYTKDEVNIMLKKEREKIQSLQTEVERLRVGIVYISEKIDNHLEICLVDGVCCCRGVGEFVDNLLTETEQKDPVDIHNTGDHIRK